MTPEDIEQLVNEEIARRQAADKLPQSNEMRRWLRHPLTITLFGFLLTTVIGSGYDSRIKMRQEQRLTEQRIVEAARESEKESLRDLRSFVELGYERQVRTDLVRSAIRRGMRAEALARKISYDKIFIAWNVELYPRPLNLRTLVGDPSKLSVYEEAIEEWVLPSFKLSDACVTSAYDIAFREGFPHPSPDVLIESAGKCDKGSWQENLRHERDKVRKCLSAILSNMTPQIRSKAANALDPAPTDEEIADRNSKISAGLAQNCDGRKPKG